MFLIFPIILAIIIVYLTGGSLKWLVCRPLRYKWLVPVALSIQILIFSDIPVTGDLSVTNTAVFHLLSYGLLLSFIIINLKVAGIAVLGAGTLLNTIAISANGGFMPNPIQPPGYIINNSIGMSINTRLYWLCDIFMIPEWFPLYNVFSIGDVLITVGMFIYLIINSRKIPKAVSDEL